MSLIDSILDSIDHMSDAEAIEKATAMGLAFLPGNAKSARIAMIDHITEEF